MALRLQNVDLESDKELNEREKGQNLHPTPELHLVKHQSQNQQSHQNQFLQNQQLAYYYLETVLLFQLVFQNRLLVFQNADVINLNEHLHQQPHLHSDKRKQQVYQSAI